MIIGPWRDRAWLPAWVGIEVIPDGQAEDPPTIKRTDDVLACLLRDAALPVGLRLKPPGPKSKHYAAFETVVRAADAIRDALPRDVHIDSSAASTAAPNEVVITVERALEVLASLHGKPFGFDFETDSLNPRAVTRIGLALADAHMAYWLIDQVTPVILPEFVKLLTDPTSEPRGSGLKYDLQVLHALFPDFEPTDCLPYDSQPMHWVYAAHEYEHGLKYQTKKYLGRDVLEFDDVGGPEHFWEQPHSLQALYAASGDARNSYDLVEYWKPRLEEAGLTYVYEELERPVTPVLAEMEYVGMHLDRRVLWDVALEFEQYSQEIREELRQLGFAGSPTNDHHIARYLYNECGMPVLVATAKQKRGSVAADVLRRLYLLRESNPAVAAHYRVIELLLEFSEVDKALSTFIMPPLRQRGMDWLYYNLKQTSVVSGRLSSEPNIQNWPAHGRRARLREMVTPPPGMAMGLADYGQVEPRLGAHYSQDTKLLDDFRSGRDVYASIGRDMGFPEAELTKHAPRRQNMKIVYLAWQYETSPPMIQSIALRQGTFLPLSEATLYHKGMTAARPGYVAWRDRLVRDAEQAREVRDLFGRRLAVWRLNAVDPATRAAARRLVVNFPNQAGAGGLIKGAMPQVHALCKQAGGGLWNQIHDELDWYVDEMTPSQKADFEHEVSRAMLWHEISVPLEVEFGWGNNWRECK